MTSLFDLPVLTWPYARTAGLSARCRGSLLAGWAQNADRRAGDGAGRALQEWLASQSVPLPLSPAKESWYPVGAQLLLSERILEHHFDGNAERFIDALIEDAGRQTPRASRLALKLGGFSTLLRLAPKVHPEAYDEGALDVRVERRIARFRYTDSLTFAHPLFGFLQGAAVLVLAEATGKSAKVEVENGTDWCELAVRWE